ncbi:MAG: hypothetical protein U5L09_12735 [Bacteroidales bacterium]|nr:hypothetical protein [Bacteroidales bacterium]
MAGSGMGPRCGGKTRFHAQLVGDDMALSGIIINDAVVFLQKYNTNLREGMKVFEAVFQCRKGKVPPCCPYDQSPPL